jgi:hypothetical protein
MLYTSDIRIENVDTPHVSKALYSMALMREILELKRELYTSLNMYITYTYIRISHTWVVPL